MLPVPERYAELRRAFPVEAIRLGYASVSLPPVEALPEAQRGYGGETDGGWKATWLVIGHDAMLGDPIFIDTADSALPVFRACHGEGDWTPDLLAPSVVGFFAILERVREMSVGRESPASLEVHPILQAEAQVFLTLVKKTLGGKVPSFWGWFIEQAEEENESKEEVASLKLSSQPPTRSPAVLEQARRRIDGLPQCFGSLKEVALRYLEAGCFYRDGYVRLGHRWRYDYDHYHITISPPAEPEWLTMHRNIEIPLDYLKFLSYMNGCGAFSMSFHGLNLNFERADLSFLNEQVRSGEFREVPRALVYIGWRHYSLTDNVSYFMAESGTVHAYLKRSKRVKSWPSLWELLSEELQVEERRIRSGSTST